jgi:hypothetical protein
MALALGSATVVLIVLLWELTRPKLTGVFARRRFRWPSRPRTVTETRYDPGRERRAEQRARALLRSCIDDDDWAMYHDLGFLRVWGGLGDRTRADGAQAPAGRSGADAEEERTADATDPTVTSAGPDAGGPTVGASYAYLIYPHRPIVAYLPETGALLNEYCVAFPDHSKPYGSARLPDSDDVLAKWMALTADEQRIIANANMHLPGRQIDPNQVRRDLWRLRQWERERLAGEHDGAGSVRA